MNIQFTDLNQPASEKLNDYTANKFQKLFKLANNNITNVQVTFNVEKLRHIVEANVQIPGTMIHAKSESEDMYKSVDLLVDKLAAQIKKYKEKQADHHS